MVTINGEQHDVVGLLLKDFLVRSGLEASRVAVELNGAILSSSLFDQYRFKDGDRVELVHFVGGG